MHRRLAGGYLAVYADVVARSNKMTPVTDQALLCAATSGWTIEAMARILLADDAETGEDRTGWSHVIAVPALQTVLPRDLAEVPVEQIIEARRRLQPEQSMARTAIAAACRSIRFSANCTTVTSENTAGDIPGAPRTPKVSTNGSSANTSASRSPTRIGRLPFGNAARATATVCSGTAGRTLDCRDIDSTPAATRRATSRGSDHAVNTASGAEN